MRSNAKSAVQVTARCASVAHPVAGNEAAKEAEFLTALEEFVVTGSHIRGGVAPASSIIIIDKEEIRRDGYASVRELINSLPQNYAGGMAENTTMLPTIDANRNVGATTTVDLRGLGAGSTLTLLNGHRLAPNGEGYAVDVSSIPLSAISSALKRRGLPALQDALVSAAPTLSNQLCGEVSAL